MTKPRLLDLFCCAGGAGMGYSRAGFEVVGVDIAPQPHYPFEFHQADAFEYLSEHGHEFDAIHASPPCQAYTRTNAKYRAFHPDFIQATRVGLQATDKPYIVENVEDARRFLINPIKLCGSMFGLPIIRHRYFEYCPGFINVAWEDKLYCRHIKDPILVTGTPRRKWQPIRKEASADEKRAAMQTPWMTVAEMDEAIPPAYTEFLGKQLMAYLTEKVSA